MQKRILFFLLGWLMLLGGRAYSQADTLCNPNERMKVFGELYFNYGTTTNALGNLNRSTMVFGQPLVSLEQMKSNGFYAGFGVYSPWYMPPQPPILIATQGDFKDRIIVKWNVNPLSTPATGFTIYRDGSFLTNISEKDNSFIDFNVQAGEYYEYSVVAMNIFGTGSPSKAVGFVNPNGVVSGKIETNSGNPVPGVEVRLTPLTGNSMEFNGVNNELCVSYDDKFPTDKFTVSAYVKLGDTNNESGIIDWGSGINSNWWITTTNTAEGKGYIFHIGNGTGSDSLKYILPNPVTNPNNVNNWHQITMVYNGSAMSVMVDGEFVGTKPATISRTKNYLNIGSKIGTDGFFKGKLDDIRIYNRPLTQTEIASTKNRSVSKNEAGLVAYWKMDEGVGAKVFDNSTKPTNANIYGAKFSTDKPEVYSAGVTDVTGYYSIDGINYSQVESFRATPIKNFEFNSSLEFNAADKAYGNLTDFDTPDTSTVEVLFYPFDLKSRQTVLSKGSLYELYVDNSKLYLNLNGNIQDLGTIKAKYYHVAVTMDNTAGKAQVYLEGEKVGGEFSYAGASNWKTGSPWLVATNDTTTVGKFYTGLVDEVAIYKGYLPQNQIQVHYVKGIPQDSTMKDLYSYFDFSEATDKFVYDYAAINFGAKEPRTGRITNATWSTNARRRETKPHEFEPNVRVVNLNTSNTAVGNIDFKDVSTVNVSGYVRFENTFCFEDSIEVLVNGQPHNPQIFTDKKGKWTADFEPGKSIKLSIVYKDHKFTPSFFEIRKIQAPRAGIVFLDNTKRFIKGQMAGGECRKSLLPNTDNYQVIKIEAANGCFSKIDTISNLDGRYSFTDLPAIAFETKYLFHSYDNTIKNYFNNKGGQFTDLRDIKGDTLDFIYIAPPQVRIDTSKVLFDKCKNMYFEQTLTSKNAAAKNMDVKFETFEQYYGGICIVDSVKYTINNDIADYPQQVIQSDTTFLRYKSPIGTPNILEPYTKKLQVVAEYKGSLATATMNAKVFGRLSRPGTFTTSTDAKPYLILHDPPGDKSVASIEKGTTMCSGYTSGWSNGIGLELSIEHTFGEITKTTLPTGGPIVEAGVETKLSVTSNNTYNNSGEENREVCITTTKTISTSEDLVGKEGDIFAGFGLNYKVGMNDVVKMGADSCTVKLDTSMYINLEGFSTEYVYTRKHIEEDVIPSLEIAYRLLDTDATLTTDQLKIKRAQLMRDIKSWKKTLLLDSVLVAHYTEGKENISFDAGAIYSKTMTTSTVESISKTDEFVTENSLGVGVEGDVPFFNSDVSATATYAHGETWTDVQSKTEEVIVSYTLSDDDIGDNFSIDIKQFKEYLNEKNPQYPKYPKDKVDAIYEERRKKFEAIEYNDALWTKAELDSLARVRNMLIDKAKRAKAIADARYYQMPNNSYQKQPFIPGRLFRIYPDPDKPSEVSRFKIYGNENLANYPNADDIASFDRYLRRDRKFNLPEIITPAFELVSGESMCPWEGSIDSNAVTKAPEYKGTLNREQVSLAVDNNTQINVPANTPAVYHLKLGNIGSALKGEGVEQMTYKLGLVSGSNPRGAVVKVNGYNITEPIPFVLYAKEVIDVTLTIEKGPEDYDYSGIKVAFFSECEVGVPNQNSKDDMNPWFYQEVSLDAKFIEPCSPVDISYPLQNFVQTPGDKNKQSISLVEYLKNDADLKDITVQYRRVDGDGAWVNIQKFLPNELADLQTNLIWNTELLRDDYYEIRAITSCNNVALAPGISTVVRGKLDRNPPEIVGVPEPGDGTWDPGDEISITFNETINCDKVVQADILANNTIGLYDATTNALVDAKISCVNNKITIVPNINPVFFENRAFRVMVSGKDYDVAKLASNPNHQAAAIRDKTDNMVEKTIKWEFYVNQNSLEWVGTDVIETNEVLKPFSVKRQIRNRGGSIAQFDIRSVPDWLTVTPMSGYLNPGQVADVTLTFAQDMLIGDYLDTLIMHGTKGDEPLLIDYRVRCPAPNYTVTNLTQYEGTMNMVVDLSIFGVKSKDPSDIIVAKIDGQVRGVGKVAYYRNIPPTDGAAPKDPNYEDTRWLAYITVYGNSDDDGKPIQFNVWDGDKCREYAEVLEQVNFTMSDIVGTPLAPQPIHVLNLVNKCIPLNKGWNWISFNLDLGNNHVRNVLSSLKNKEGVLIKDDNVFAKYYGTPINNWKGTLDTLRPQKRYMIYVADKDTICLKGMPYKAANYPINIVQGWNWIGYVPSVGMSVAQAFKGLTPLNGDIIKSQTVFAQYVAGTGWIGNLNYLEPNKGYLLKISNIGNLKYQDPGSARQATMAEARESAETPVLDYSFTQYQSTMNVIGRVEGMTIDADDELRAYIDGKLVGKNNALLANSQQLFFQTIYHQDRLNIKFMLYKADRKKEYELNRSMTFKADSLAGLVEDPVVFKIITAAATPVTINLANSTIWQPVTIFPTVSIKSGVVENTANCTSYAFNSILPVGTATKPTCTSPTGYEGNMTGVAKMVYNERSTFANASDVITFINPADNKVMGCATFDPDFKVFNYTIKGGTSSTEIPMNVQYYSEAMKTTFTKKAALTYKNNKELGTYFIPFQMDVSPLTVSSDANGVVTAVMKDTSWTGKYCVDAFAMNCTGFNDGQTTFCFQRLKAGDCVDVIVRKVTETTDTVVQALKVSGQAMINTGVKIDYKGGKSIELTPGFEAKAGSVFTGKIEGCNNK